ncbi:hypothetical protein CEXT_52071, partial [Caerostris extrusa]
MYTGSAAKIQIEKSLAKARLSSKPES